MMEAAARIFVYGTLRRLGGNPMHRLLGDAKFLGNATCGGDLYCAGFYPVLTRTPDSANRVVGEVYELSDPDRVMAALDDYEGYNPSDAAGSLFVRERTPVQFETGETVEVWIYCFNGQVGHMDRIRGGDFARWIGRG